MIRCVKCNRVLRRPPEMTPAGPMGPKCALSTMGLKVRRVRAKRRKDERQGDMFGGV